MNNNSNNRKPKQSRRRLNNNKKTNRRNKGNSIVPIVVSQPTLRTTFRFRAQAAASSTIFVRDIYNLLYIAATNILGYSIIAAYRILRIDLNSIAPGGAGTEFNTNALTYYGGLFSRPTELTSAGSSAMPGRIVSFPPKSSGASFWRSVPTTGAISNNGEPLFSISSLGAGDILDLYLQFILCDGSSLVGSSLTLAAATPGLLYTNSLDNSTTSGASGTNNFQPVGRFFLLGFG